MKIFIALLGLVLVMEGLPYVAFPEAMRRWLSQLARMEPAQIRSIGLVSMACGFAILIVARSFGLLG